MDPRQFDHLIRALSAAGTRRGLLARLGAVPVLGGLLAVLDPENAEGKGRRKRRKKRHKHGKGRRRTHRRGKPKPPPACVPESQTQTCAGKCGSVQNNCQQLVACDPCVTCTGLTPADDLQEAIDAASDGATLTLCAGTWTPAATLVIGKSLTLIGAEASQTLVDGNNQRRVLDISANVTVVLQGLTITRGLGTTFSAGILNEGDLTLVDAVVTNNHGAPDSSNSGGGIFTSGALTLRRTRITANGAYLGGGINNYGGSVILEQGSVIGGDTAEDANVSDNEGGGIYSLGGAVTLQSGSRVAGNTARFFGGGISISTGLLALEDGSRVTGNSVVGSGSGGAISTAPNATVTIAPGALVCDNPSAGSSGQCFIVGSLTGNCPNPPSGICPT